MGILIALLMIYMVALPIYLTILILKPMPKKNKKAAKRIHTSIASTSLITPLNPYKQYQDKKTGLYIPIKNSGTARNEVHK